MKAFVLSPSISFSQRSLKNILKIFFLINFFFAWILLLLYIVQVGLYTKEFYQQQKYKKEIFELSKEIDLLSIEFAKNSSLSNVENYLQKDSFVKVNPKEVKYIQIFENSLVTK